MPCPGGQIVLLVTMIRDSEGRAISSREVARQLSAVSQAPIHGLSRTIMDTGAANQPCAIRPSAGVTLRR